MILLDLVKRIEIPNQLIASRILAYENTFRKTPTKANFPSVMYVGIVYFPIAYYLPFFVLAYHCPLPPTALGQLAPDVVGFVLKVYPRYQRWSLECWNQTYLFMLIFQVYDNWIPDITTTIRHAIAPLLLPHSWLSIWVSLRDK